MEKDNASITFSRSLLQANALVVFYYHLFGNLERKISKKLLEINKKASIVTLIGNVVWYPERFLLKHVIALSKVIDIKTWVTKRKAQIASRTNTLLKDSQALSVKVY